ncbi:MAG: DMT family transporter [Rhizobiales bacterium]|nr:DMT family transporter [Hyphomicrobiales bacterium]MBI3674874.1 DMT family transporter [Hyphomicrobiales bacterium]
MSHQIRPLDWGLLAILTSAWGGSFAMTKVAVTHLDAAWVMALRLSVAALVLAPYARLTGNGPGGAWSKYAWLGFIGHALPFFLITWGTHYVTSGVSGLLMGTIPLFVIAFAHVLLPDEKLNLPKAVGFVLGFAGIVVLIGPENIFAMAMTGDALKGQLAIIAGCFCYAIHGVTAKRLGFDHPLRQTSSVCLAAAAMGLPFALLVSPQGLAGQPPAAFLAVAGLGIVPTALASLLAYRLIERTGPSFVSYANYLVPIFALGLGAALLGEAVSWNAIAALALILTGIAVSRMKY